MSDIVICTCKDTCYKAVTRRTQQRHMKRGPFLLLLFFFFFFAHLVFLFLAFGLFQADSVSLLHSAATTTGAPTPPLGLVAGNQVLGSAGDVANPEVPNDPPQAPPELDRQHTFIPMDVDFDEQAMWMGYGGTDRW